MTWGRRVPLERGIGYPIEDLRGGILFAMVDGHRTVRCLVSGDALIEMAGGSVDSPRLAFMVHRHQIEIAASTKYDRGHRDSDGGIGLAAGDCRADPAPPA